MLRLNSDGSFANTPCPSIEELVRHAQRFGVDCIAETAAQWMGVETLAELIACLDRVEQVEDAKRRFSRTKRRRKSPADRAKELLGIEDDEEDE